MLTLKIYTKGERVLRIEVVVHNTEEIQCGRSLERFPQIVVQAKEILERFMNALSCIDQCFIADSMLDELPDPIASRYNQSRWNRSQQASHALVVEAVIALCLMTLTPKDLRLRSWLVRSACSATKLNATMMTVASPMI
jgi:hypothetical protein